MRLFHSRTLKYELLGRMRNPSSVKDLVWFLNIKKSPGGNRWHGKPQIETLSLILVISDKCVFLNECVRVRFIQLYHLT